MSEIKLHKSWLDPLVQEFSKPYFKELKSKIQEDLNSGITIYPPALKIFAALDITPLSEIKVVIIGQDPYHGIGQANGLCFSVNNGIKPPPSLVNIYKEIETEFGYSMDFTNGNLEKWAKQGVLLLNAILTVRAHEPASHKEIGWETFTNEIISLISKVERPIVFMLWGNFAKSKKQFITNPNHLVLEAAHPSPFSAYQGFFKCNHFIQANLFLQENGIQVIDWKI